MKGKRKPKHSKRRTRPVKGFVKPAEAVRTYGVRARASKIDPEKLKP